MFQEATNPPPAHGVALFNAVFKQSAADFQVYEELNIDFSGAGEHLYLQVEKSSMNTDEVLSFIQACYSLGSADVGLCGLKDRHSVSTQWFSVRTNEVAELFVDKVSTFNQQQADQWGEDDTQLKSMQLIRSERHSRKLRRGAHRCNHFDITLRAIQPTLDTGSDLLHAVSTRMDTISSQGFPAYIGPQRFGENARNLQRALQWLKNPRKRTSRQQRSLWLSSARSALFNVVCAARVKEQSWQQAKPGEPLVLDGSKSFFLSEGAGEDTESLKPESIEQRLAQFDVHPSAPWWGRGRSPALGSCAEFEQHVLQPFGTLLEGLERAGLEQERRAIRARASDVTINWLSTEELRLQFSLSPGLFATSLLRELVHLTEPER